MWKSLLIALWITTLAVSAQASRTETVKVSNVSVADELGQSHSLYDYLKEKTLLVMGYYQCKHMCNFMIKDLTKKLSKMKAAPAVVYFGIDENEGPRDALRMRKRIFGPLKSKWHFLISDKTNIEKVAKDLSFQMKRDPVSGAIIHELGLYVMDGHQVLSKLPDVEFTEKDLTITKPETKSDFMAHIKRFCSEFDPMKSKYGPLIMKSLSGASILFLILCALFWRRLVRVRA